jgi:hypothetical protein
MAAKLIYLFSRLSLMKIECPRCFIACCIMLYGMLAGFPLTAAGGEPLRAQANRIAKDQRHFEHADGTPFFWLGDTWYWTTWQEGMNYAGSTQLGLGKKLLEKYPWWRFEPHPKWVDAGCHAAGIHGEVRFIYLPRRNIYNWDGPTVRNLEPDVAWHAYYFDPAPGRQFDQGVLKARAQAGDTTAQPVEFKKNVPSPQDWVLVLERVKP